MRILHNRTFVNRYEPQRKTKSGIELSTKAKAGLCCMGKVVGIGDQTYPIEALYKEGDIVVFQRNAVTGTLLNADFVIQNIDILGKVDEKGNVVPLNDVVLVIQDENVEDTLETGIIQITDSKKFNTFGKVVSKGSDSKNYVIGDRVALDPYAGSIIMVDNSYKVNNEFEGNYRIGILYREKSILAKVG